MSSNIAAMWFWIMLMVLALSSAGCDKKAEPKTDFYRGLVAMEVEIKDEAPKPSEYRCKGTGRSGDGLGPCPGCPDCKGKKPGNPNAPRRPLTATQMTFNDAPAVPVTRVTEGILFGADWCGPCHGLEAELKAAGLDVGEGPGHQIRKVNVDALKADETDYPTRYSYPGKVPYFVAVNRQGVPIAGTKITGRQPLGEYQKALRKAQR